MSIWINCQSDSISIIGRQDLLCMWRCHTCTMSISRRDVIHLKRRNLWQISYCFLVLLAIFSPSNYSTPMVIRVALPILGLTILLLVSIWDFRREERSRGHSLFNALHFIGSVADHASCNRIITLLNSTRTRNSHI